MPINVFSLKTVTCKKYNDLEGRHCKKYRQGKASEKLEMTDRAYMAARGDAGEGSCGTPLLLTGGRAVAPAAAGYRTRRLLENDHDARLHETILFVEPAGGQAVVGERNFAGKLAGHQLSASEQRHVVGDAVHHFAYKRMVVVARLAAALADDVIDPVTLSPLVFIPGAELTVAGEPLCGQAGVHVAGFVFRLGVHIDAEAAVACRKPVFHYPRVAELGHYGEILC